MVCPVFLRRLTLTDSDSDASSIGQAPTNRGRKLKRNARYVHQGRLAGEYGLMLDGAVFSISRLCMLTPRLWNTAESYGQSSITIPKDDGEIIKKTKKKKRTTTMTKRVNTNHMTTIHGHTAKST